MNLRSLAGAAALSTASLTAWLTGPDASAQAKEQFFPVLTYRTEAYAPNGIPMANGYIDYFKLVNAQGGINGVRIVYEECETACITARGIECYERLKAKHGGATVFQPQSTGLAFALTEKAPTDKIPLITTGYGRSDTQDGTVFKWNFPLHGTHWVAADTVIQAIAKKEGGLDKLKGRKLAYIYHDSPYGKEAIALLQERSRMLGYESQSPPVTHPGIEQKATWLQVRQGRPDYVLLVGLGGDEFHRAQGSHGHRLPAREDVRLLVVGRRARRQGCGRRRQGLQRSLYVLLPARLEDRQGHPRRRSRQGPGEPARARKWARCSTCAAWSRRCWRSRACAGPRNATARARFFPPSWRAGDSRTWRSTRRSSTPWASPVS